MHKLQRDFAFAILRSRNLSATVIGGVNCKCGLDVSSDAFRAGSIFFRNNWLGSATQTRDYLKLLPRPPVRSPVSRAPNRPLQYPAPDEPRNRPNRRQPSHVLQRNFPSSLSKGTGVSPCPPFFPTLQNKHNVLGVPRERVRLATEEGGLLQRSTE